MRLPAISFDYARCIKCERVYPTIESAQYVWQCRSPNCNGAPHDVWEWREGQMLLTAHSEYPQVPEVGER